MQHFTQIAYYIMFQSYENPEGSNPMPDSIEAVLQTFMMSLGSFGGHWWDLESTNHSFIGKVIVLQCGNYCTTLQKLSKCEVKA